MRQDRLTFYEEKALDDAGATAGAYLEGIGKFSLVELTEEEWRQFLKTVLVSYGEKMRERVLGHAAPF